MAQSTITDYLDPGQLPNQDPDQALVGSRAKKSEKRRRNADERSQLPRRCKGEVIADGDELDDRDISELIPTPSPQGSVSTAAELAPALDRKQIILFEKRIADLNKHNSRLRNHVELLESEIDKLGKVDKKQKKEIKRLIKENDNVRADLSRNRGMRKFVKDTSKSDKATCTDMPAPSKSHVTSHSVGTCTDLPIPSNSHATSHSVDTERIQSLTAQFDSLKEFVSSVANSMQSVISDNTNPQSSSNHIARPTSPTPNSGVRSIPVVQIGLAGQHAHHPDHDVTDRTYADVTAQLPPRQQSSSSRPAANRPAKDSVYVIGTSLTTTLGDELDSRGVNASVFTYKGAQIPRIRQRIPHIFPKTKKPTKIVLQCGGNDVTERNVDDVIDQYEGLIKDVRRECPNSDILLSTVPPRGDDTAILDKIKYLNEYITDRGKNKDRVFAIDVVPKTYTKFFKKDKVHFNRLGLNVYAHNMKRSLATFTSTPTKSSV